MLPNPATALVVLGIVAILAGIVGGGIKFATLELPKATGIQRGLVVGFGLLTFMLGLAIDPQVRSALQGGAAGQPTVVAQVAQATPVVEPTPTPETPSPTPTLTLTPPPSDTPPPSATPPPSPTPTIPPTETPSETPAETPTEAPTDAPAPTSTPRRITLSRIEPEGAGVAAWRALLDETRATEPMLITTFDSAADNSWLTESDANSQRMIEEGALHLVISDPNWMAYATASTVQADDLLLEFEATVIDGSAQGAWGAIYRAQDGDTLSTFLINGRGEYLSGHRAGGDWGAPPPWTASELLGRSETTTLSLLARGPRVAVFVDDEFLTKLEGVPLGQGRVGLAVNTIDASELHVAFDNVRLWPLEPELPAADFEFLDLAAALDPIRSAEPARGDDFAQSIDGWNNTLPLVNRWEEGRLHVEVWDRQPNSSVMALPVPVSDFLMQVDVAVEEPEAVGNSYNLAAAVLSADGITLLLAMVDPLGNFTLTAADGASLTNLSSDTAPPLLNGNAAAIMDLSADAVNRLAILSQGGRLAFLINDHVVGETDMTPGSSVFPALGAQHASGPGAVVAFDNFALWDLTGAAPLLGE